MLCLFVSLSAGVCNASEWRTVSDGFLYKKITVAHRADLEKPSAPGSVHLLLINPSKFRLSVATAGQFGLSSADAKTYAEKSGAVAAINGGFFTPDYKPLGLIVNNGKTDNAIKWVSWWHVFQVTDGRAQVVTKPEFLLTPGTEMAIEAGPRLLVAGEPPATLKPSSAERSAIGVTANGMIIIAATEAAPLGMKEFAGILKDAGCQDALNLDGGSSTQIYVDINGFKLHRPGFGPVADAVIVMKR
jgi:uncharacterized protein YigE (DUF2233 family)